jgi:hypothetical protein
MSESPALFSDGKAYERLMGRWSQLAGKQFLDWLALPKSLRWLDVGCDPRHVAGGARAIQGGAAQTSAAGTGRARRQHSSAAS